MANHQLYPIPHPQPHYHHCKARPWFSHYYLDFSTYFPGRVFYFNQFYKNTIPVLKLICISLYVTCIRQQFYTCSHNAQQSDTICHWITIWVCYTKGGCQRRTTNFRLILLLLSFLSRLAGAQSAYCMTCLKILGILFHFKDSMTLLPVYFWMILCHGG